MYADEAVSERPEVKIAAPALGWLAMTCGAFATILSYTAHTLSWPEIALTVQFSREIIRLLLTALEDGLNAVGDTCEPGRRGRLWSVEVVVMGPEGQAADT